MGTTPYTIRIDDDLKRALEQEARLEDRPPAQLAVRAIRSMLEAKRSKRDAIEAALAEAEQGRFISEAAMLGWVESWDSDDEGPVPEADIRPAP